MRKNISKYFEQKKLVTFVVGVLIGVIVFLIQYGFDVLRFTNVEWLTHSNEIEGLWDLTQHYFGWVWYRNSAWKFPIGLLEGVACSPISVAYTDSIPLFAIFFKCLSPILPENFQYFGVFELITYMLMGGLGGLITYKFTKNIINNSISAILFIISPVLLKRTFYHSALSAHFVLLAAICLWIYKDEISDKMRILWWSVLTILCVLINPYYVPMVIGILLCSLLQELILNRKILYTMGAVLIPGISSLFVGWIIGLFYGDVSATGRGIEKVNFNLNQLFNPYNPLLRHSNYQFDKMSYSTFLPDLPLNLDWQTEGFSYLGLGCILLAIFVFVLWLIHLVQNRQQFKNDSYMKKFISYVVSIAIGVVVFTLIALGPVATLGKLHIYSINWPESIYSLFAMFRTAGRFIWPVYYGIMSLSLIGVNVLLNKKNISTMILIVVVVIQVVDLWPSFVYKHEAYKKADVFYKSEYVNPICRSKMWQDIAAQVDEIIFATPTETTICFLAEKSCTFEAYCIENNIKMSASYCSRDVSKIADEYAKNNYARRKNGELFPHIVYVMLSEDMTQEVKDAGLTVYKADGYYVASDIDLSIYDEAKVEV